MKKERTKVYILKFYSDNPYYKIGYTTNIIKRYLFIKLPKYECVYYSTFPKDMGRLVEQTLHEYFHKKRFTSPLDFDGRTECFRLNKKEFLEACNCVKRSKWHIVACSGI